MMLRILSLLIFVLFLMPLYPQNETVNTNINQLINFEAIPSDPVFELLGITGANIGQPGTISSFLGSVSSFTDLRGNLSPAIALSIAPYQLFYGNNLTLKKYTESTSTRILSNMQFSLGTASKLSADSSLDWGAGLRVVFFNSGDARLDTNNINMLIERAQEILNSLNNPEVGEIFDPEEEERRAEKLVQINNEKSDLEASKENAENLDSRWNAASLDLNVGAVFTASDSKLQKSEFTKFRGWLNGGVGYGNFQLLGQIGALYENLTDSLLFHSALMIRAGTPTFRIGVGSAVQNFKNGNVIIAGEFRLNDNAWVAFSVERKFYKHSAPFWVQSVGLKTTMGLLNY